MLLALKSGHERITSLLAKHGAALNLEDAGGYVCRVVTDGKVDLLSRLLRSGVDPNCRNYDQRTPLHVAAAEGLHLVASMLVGFGADVLAKDRCVAACMHGFSLTRVSEEATTFMSLLPRAMKCVLYDAMTMAVGGETRRWTKAGDAAADHWSGF